MRIAIHGPNGSWTGPTFHVHTADCADRKKRMYRGGLETSGYVYDAGTDDALTIAAEWYEDQIAEGGMDAQDALDDFRFFPCTGL